MKGKRNPKQEIVVAKPAASLQSSLFDLELFLSTNDDPEQRFQAIDREVRHVESVVTGWPRLARYCQLVETEKLYQHGGYKTMTQWLQNAAPKSERSIRDYLALHKNLSPDFTDLEQGEMPVETAKFIAKNVTSHEHRKNPKIKAASKKEKADCVKDVREELPELHLEDIVNVTFTESQMESIKRVLEWYKAKEDEPEMTTPEAIEGALEDYRALRERLDAIEVDEVRDVAWQR